MFAVRLRALSDYNVHHTASDQKYP